MLRKGMVAVVLGLSTAFPAFAQESARIVRVQPITDVLQGVQKGMVIQLDSQINGLQNRQVLLRALFYTAGGQPLPARRGGAFSTPDGYVSAPVVRTPPFAMATLNN